MINKLLILLAFILTSCDPSKSGAGSKLEILDSSNKLIFQDNDAQVDTANKEFILIMLSKKQTPALKAITSSKIGEDVYVKLNGVVIKQVRIFSSIDSGIIRVDKK